jgi:hypothetical protein
MPSMVSGLEIIQLPKSRYAHLEGTQRGTHPGKQPRGPSLRRPVHSPHRSLGTYCRRAERTGKISLLDSNRFAQSELLQDLSKLRRETSCGISLDRERELQADR